MLRFTLPVDDSLASSAFDLVVLELAVLDFAAVSAAHRNLVPDRFDHALANTCLGQIVDTRIRSAGNDLFRRCRPHAAKILLKLSPSLAPFRSRRTLVLALAFGALFGGAVWPWIAAPTLATAKHASETVTNLVKVARNIGFREHHTKFRRSLFGQILMAT